MAKNKKENDLKKKMQQVMEIDKKEAIKSKNANDKTKEDKKVKTSKKKKIDLEKAVLEKEEKDLNINEIENSNNSNKLNKISKTEKTTEKPKNKMKKDKIFEDEDKTEELFLGRMKFGFEQESILEDKLKTATIDKIIDNKKIKNKEEQEIDENLVKKGMKRYVNLRTFGKKNKEKLLSKMILELVIFTFLTILILVAYLFVFKERKLNPELLKILSLIIGIFGIVFLEIGFNKKLELFFLRGLELISFSYMYIYYINLITNSLSYPQIQKNFIITIYGYFIMKIGLISFVEKKKHKETYIDAKQITQN